MADDDTTRDDNATPEDEPEVVKEVVAIAGQKARYWVAVLYPENMIEGWEDEIDEILQLPYAYCVHDADVDGKGDERKEHVHIMIAFPNTTTYKHALNTFSRLSADGKQACNTCQNVVGVRYMYDYLIHDTDKARKAGKKLYDKSERICGNGFDIGLYEQLSVADKQKIREELADMIVANDFTNYTDFYVALASGGDENKIQVAIESSAFLERLTRGNYLRHKGESEDL